VLTLEFDLDDARNQSLLEELNGVERTRVSSPYG